MIESKNIEGRREIKDSTRGMSVLRGLSLIWGLNVSIRGLGVLRGLSPLQGLSPLRGLSSLRGLNVSIRGLSVLLLGGCKSRVVGCGPDCWSVPHTVCTGGRCGCGRGYQAATDTQGNILSCTASIHNSSLQADQASKTVNDINIHYYPGEKILRLFSLELPFCYFQKLVFSTTGCLQ